MSTSTDWDKAQNALSKADRVVQVLKEFDCISMVVVPGRPAESYPILAEPGSTIAYLSFTYRETVFVVYVHSDGRATFNTRDLLSPNTPLPNPFKLQIGSDGFTKALLDALENAAHKRIRVTDGTGDVLLYGSQDEDTLERQRFVHSVCGGSVERMRSSDRYDVLLCKTCSLRVGLPIGVKTIKAIRGYFSGRIVG